MSAYTPSDETRVEPLRPGEEAAWDAFVDAHPRGTLYHSTRWNRLMAEVFGNETRYLVARGATGALRGVLPLVRLKSVLFGDFVVSLPYVNYGGALGDSPPVETALMHAGAEWAGSVGSRHVEYRDVEPRAGEWPARTDKVGMTRALPDDPDALFKALGSKLRAQVKRPSREGATAHHGGAELAGEFYDVFARNMRDLGTPVYSRRLFDAILGAFPDAARIVVVRVGGAPAAAGFLLTHRGRTEIPWASSVREHNRIGVNMLLYWEAIRSAIEAGVEVFDFGRSSREGGTYRFKSQWGAEPVDLNWHYWLREGGDLPGLTPSNPKFRAAIAVWQRLPLWITRLAGPSIVRNLP